MAGPRPSVQRDEGSGPSIAPPAADPRATRAVQRSIKAVKEGDAVPGLARLLQAWFREPGAPGVLKTITRVAVRDTAWIAAEAGGHGWLGPLAAVVRRLGDRADDADLAEGVALCQSVRRRDGRYEGLAAWLIFLIRLAHLDRRDLVLRCLTEVPLAAELGPARSDLLRVVVQGRILRFGNEIFALHRRLQASALWRSPELRMIVYREKLFLEGCSDELIDDLTADLACFPADADLAGVACMAAASGRRDDALQALVQAHPAGAQSALLNPAVAQAWSRLPALPPLPAEAAMLAQAFTTLERNWQDFATALSSAATIAIVGNGPSEIGRRWGPAIDDHEMVIRMNDFGRGPDFADDYGEKCHAVIFALAGEALDECLRTTPSDVLIILKDAIEPARRLPDAILKAIAEGRRIAITPIEDHLALRRALRAKPSTGLFMVHAARRLRRGMAGIDCFGFDFTAQLIDGAASHYYDDKPAQSTHAWHAEAALFLQYLGSS